MNPEEWWKNFGMGLEINVAASFIYNAIKHLHQIDSLNCTEDIFEILYGLSIGIERLQKIAIVLIEHKDGDDISLLEESLISHSTIDLSNRIDEQYDQDLSGVHKEFLSLISKFYKSYRYGRYSLTSIPEIHTERDVFVQYLSKHLSIDFPEDSLMELMPNTDRIRRFIGRINKKITGGLYKIICSRGKDLNLYTYELRTDSKAQKVFLEDHLDFIDEDRIKKEVLLYLINSETTGNRIDLIKGYEVLNLDLELVPDYIRLLINDLPVNQLMISSEVRELYHDVDNVSERLEFLENMDGY